MLLPDIPLLPSSENETAILPVLLKESKEEAKGPNTCAVLPSDPEWAFLPSLYNPWLHRWVRNSLLRDSTAVDSTSVTLPLSLLFPCGELLSLLSLLLPRGELLSLLSLLLLCGELLSLLSFWPGSFMEHFFLTIFCLPLPPLAEPTLHFREVAGSGVCCWPSLHCGTP